MPNDITSRSIRIRRTFPADVARVWSAFTQPQSMAAWMWGSLARNVMVSADVAVGGRYRIATEGNEQPGWPSTSHAMEGLYVEVDPRHRLVYTLRWDAPVVYNQRGTPVLDEVVVVQFEGGDGSTLVDLHHMGIPDDLDAARAHADGIANTLDHLEAWLSMDSQIEEVLGYWFGELEGPHDVDRSRKDLWWKGTPAIDADVAARFGPLVREACEGGLRQWTTTARGTLALVIVLDQFTRNVFRGEARAYAGDPLAVALVDDAVSTGQHRELRLIERSFLYMPLMHAEGRDVARRSLALFEALSEEIAACSTPNHPDFLSSAHTHADIVLQFGRFPHRNELLGRTASDDERGFLEGGGPTFGQRKA